MAALPIDARAGMFTFDNIDRENYIKATEGDYTCLPVTESVSEALEVLGQTLRTTSTSDYEIGFSDSILTRKGEKLTADEIAGMFAEAVSCGNTNMDYMIIGEHCFNILHAIVASPDEHPDLWEVFIKNLLQRFPSLRFYYRSWQHRYNAYVGEIGVRIRDWLI